MLIYLLECTILSWLNVGWLTLQATLYNVDLVDAAFVYPHALFLIFLLILAAITEIHTQIIFESLYAVNLAWFLFYIHALELAMHHCSYQYAFFNDKPVQVILIYASISLAFAIIHLILAAATVPTILLYDPEWVNVFFLITTTAHLIVASNHFTWGAALFLVVSIFFFIFTVIPYIFNISILWIYIRGALFWLWICILYIHIVVHTGVVFFASFIPLIIVAFINTIHILQSPDDITFLKKRL